MNKKIKNIIGIVTFSCFLITTAIICILKPADSMSESERRALASFPKCSSETIFSGEFAKGFENYAVDQFPFRDKLRTLKAMFSYNILNKADNNGLFTFDGHISKIEYPKNPDMIEYAQKKFRYLYDEFMKDTNANIYFSIIPDKSMLLAKKSGHLSIDYDDFVNDFTKKTEYMKYIDISPLLSTDDYYKTDSHWKQENIIDVAKKLGDAMGVTLSGEYTRNILENDFYGVYAGQSAIPCEPDEIVYLTNSAIDNCTVTSYATGMAEKSVVYNMDKAYSKDPYEMFLSGSEPLLEIENENATTDKELIIFRDSFGSSLSPLFIEAYKKITVIDIRYIQSNFIGSFVEFDNQDVLFIYSTTLLNNSTALK